MTASAPVRPVLRTRVVVVWALIALLVMVVAAGAWVGIRALLAQDELAKIAPLADRFRSAMAAGDLDGLQGVAGDLADASGRAAGLTGDPVWRSAELLPWVGDDLRAARVASAELSSVATNAVTPLLSLARDIAVAQPSGGGAIDLAVLQGAAEPLERAATSLESARSELSTIDRDGLIPQLAGGVSELSSAVEAGADAARGFADAAVLLPGMLGADAPRTLLLMLQNNAELRTGGGITGSFAQLQADGGRLSLVAQADSGDFEIRSAPILPVPEPVTALYGDVVGRFVQNSTMPADFTLSSQLASAWWQERTGIAPDVVVSIDPLVLRSLLAVAGPVTLADGSQLTSDNLVQRLLVDPYLTLDPQAQSVFQQQVTSAVFGHLLSGSVSPIAWAEGLSGPIADGRVSVWSADGAEQEILSKSPLAGPLARHLEAGPDAYAVYLNDMTGSKMDSFLDVTIGTGVTTCRQDERPEVVVAVTLSSSAPLDAAALPGSMTGDGQWGTPPGVIATGVTVAAPPGSYFAGVRTDGQPTLSADVEAEGFASSVARVTLAPGQVSTTEFRFVAAEPGPVEPRILHTPLLRSPSIGEVPVTCG